MKGSLSSRRKIRPYGNLFKSKTKKCYEVYNIGWGRKDSDGGSYFIGEMIYYLNTDFGKLNVYMISLKVTNKIL